MQCYIDWLGFDQKSLYTLLSLSQIVVILSCYKLFSLFLNRRIALFPSFCVCVCVIMLQLTHFHKQKQSNKNDIVCLLKYLGTVLSVIDNIFIIRGLWFCFTVRDRQGEISNVGQSLCWFSKHSSGWDVTHADCKCQNQTYKKNPISAQISLK